MEIVQDTNVFVAALRSEAGAGAEVLDRCLARDDQAVMGAALIAEYEELVQRKGFRRGVPVTAAERKSLPGRLLRGGDLAGDLLPLAAQFAGCR
jgi:predicted nucleic acid-binding protein